MPELEVSTREVERANFAWLFKLHTLTMRQYVEPVYGWEPEVQEKLFFYDFRPQAIRIITESGVDSGMFELDRDRDGFYLRRFEILPRFQSKGIGSRIISEIIDEARDAGEKVWLTVLKNNPAKAFYERLGFEAIEELSFHFKMIHTCL